MAPHKYVVFLHCCQEQYLLSKPPWIDLSHLSIRLAKISVGISAFSCRLDLLVREIFPENLLLSGDWER
jgi:hypothetical protein